MNRKLKKQLLRERAINLILGTKYLDDEMNDSYLNFIGRNRKLFHLENILIFRMQKELVKDLGVSSRNESFP